MSIGSSPDKIGDKATASMEANNAALANAGREIGTLLQNANLNSQRSLNATTEAAQKTQEKYLKTATEQAKLGNERSRADNAPYRNVGYQSLDRYMDTLGMARPEVGSQALADSLYKEAEVAQQRAKLTEAAHQLDATFPMWSSGIGNFKGSSRAVGTLDDAKNVAYRVDQANQNGKGPNLIPTLPIGLYDQSMINQQAATGQSASGQQAGKGGVGDSGSSWLGQAFLGSTNTGNYQPNQNLDVMGGLQRFLAQPGQDYTSTGQLNNVDDYILNRLTPEQFNKMQNRTALDFVDEYMKSVPYQLGKGYIFPDNPLPSGMVDALNYYYNQNVGAWDQYKDLMTNYSPEQQKISQAYNMGLYSPTQWKDVTY